MLKNPPFFDNKRTKKNLRKSADRRVNDTELYTLMPSCAGKTLTISKNVRSSITQNW